MFELFFLELFGFIVKIKEKVNNLKLFFVLCDLEYQLMYLFLIIKRFVYIVFCIILDNSIVKILYIDLEEEVLLS